MAKISKESPAFLNIKENEGFDPRFQGGDLLGFLQAEPTTHIPDIDMLSTPGELIIEVEMPGVRKDDIELCFCKNTLTLKALKLECIADDRINYVCMERVFGRFYRSIEVPFPVDTSRIKAVYDNGVLRITIPRVEDKRSVTKNVPIETGE